MPNELNKRPTESELESAVKRMLDRLDEINTLFITKIAAQVKKIGTLNASSVNRLVIMADMGADVSEITTRLADAVGLNVRDLTQVYDRVLKDTYADPRFAVYLQQNPVSVATQRRLTQYVQSVSVQTAQSLINLSNTTAISEPYRKAIDTAVLAVSSGLSDYKSATRDVIEQLGYNGMQVYYASGYHRRLDTAIRQNIIDSTNQIAQNASIMMGEDLGFDAIELSAHARSAPDHEPAQGRVFLKSEFQKMQAGEAFVDVDGHSYTGFKRPIGEWNCMHIAMGFSTQHSVRRYTDEQLRAWRDANQSGCEINGKRYTTYKAVQLMRKIETEVRRQKDVAVAARAADDTELQKSCQEKINSLSAYYTQIAQAAKITPRRDRMTVQGFRAYKIN